MPDTLPGVGGLPLACRGWQAARPRAAIILVHGLGEHSGRYAEFGESMAAAGISTYAMDLRGHGASGGRRGHVPALAVHLEEVDAFRRQVERVVPAGLPLFLLGQSMGGLIAIRYLEEYGAVPLRGAIICSPWLATAMPVPRWKIALAAILTRLLPALQFRTGLVPEHLSRDPEVVRAYRADPLVHSRITARTFTEVSAAMGLAVECGHRIARPLLFVLGGADRIVDAAAAAAFARALPAGDVTVDIRDGHFHEPLNELHREQVHRSIRDWLVARL
jgi:alpha-beta hydrolase superfamily lysophospholipase